MLGLNEPFNPKEIIRSIMSPHVFLVFLVFFLGGAIFFGLAIFLPSIIRPLSRRFSDCVRVLQNTIVGWTSSMLANI